MTWLYKDFSHLATPIKYQYLTRFTVFDTRRVGILMTLLIIVY
jgi:hypothetical protein